MHPSKCPLYPKTKIREQRAEIKILQHVHTARTNGNWQIPKATAAKATNCALWIFDYTTIACSGCGWTWGVLLIWIFLVAFSHSNLTWLRQKAVMESCSLWMMRTGSGRFWESGGRVEARSVSAILGAERRLPNTHRMNNSCTGSWRTRKLQSRRAGAADQCRGL